MRVRWTPNAADDLQHIFDYLIAHDARLARPTVISIRDAILSLKEFPRRGRPGLIEGTRELLHGRLPHIVSYRVREETIEILHIWHPAQDRH
ncbi:MAG: type II toxin-antitoxin system RelE/ParE family toxin [Acidobacteriia bacterium]|nr:type II toxin-antitoxin system RelE/ParE family toxin [Terriglobia bacterium]